MKSVHAVHAWLEGQHPGRVHRPRTAVFHARPGHYYLVDPPEDEAAGHQLLADISARSGNAEASLIRINQAVVVSVARASAVTAPIEVPRRTIGITHFEWLAHTHPHELVDRYHPAPNAPTANEIEVLTRVAHVWGPQATKIVVCKAGAVLETVPLSA